MDTRKALAVIQALIDQATAQGGFKTANECIVAVSAWNVLKAAIDKEVLPIPTNGEQKASIIN